MKFKLESIVDYFLIIMLAVKLIFLISTIGHVITIKSSNPNIAKHELLLRKISGTTEMIFIFGMSTFLIFYFRPNKKNFIISRETALLLFAYGIVMLIGAFKRYHISTPLDKLKEPKKKGDTQTSSATEPPSTNPPSPPTSSAQFSPFETEQK
jgi:hypothetical protein